VATDQHLTAVPDRDNAETPGGVPTAEALASFLRHLAGRRGRSGRITSPETVRAYTSALPTAFTGIVHLGELASVGRDRLHTNIRGGSTGSSPTNAARWKTGRCGRCSTPPPPAPRKSCA
jgi:integrase/recombinase XerC